MVNLVARYGMTWIVQGVALPLSVTAKLWALMHMPSRLYVLLSEKFMVDRDDIHKKHLLVEKKFEHGMENYLKQILSEGKKTEN